ncbi:unnamed protein product [Rhizophagus irregularis]|uniref:Uncharacterized protein n=1 Tax=Rhizophagus irregularis TaxID=588596 RepID=A0A916E5J5_9GLOM|nr:unnamed protein product [Rhizophagus irregularis]CAB4495927.1 unnamed protein product [Rhizophagus irregularis]CAB5355291.1 unnamed protein product [Rhizophagus irregularis]CAB5362370.1 unnamed protein product [Rhizophagus irregularis]
MYIKMIYHLPGTNNKIIICAKDFSFLINFYSVNTTIASFSEKGDQNEFWKKEIKNSFFNNSEKFDGLRKFSNFLLVNVSSPQIHYTLTDQIQLLLKIYEF